MDFLKVPINSCLHAQFVPSSTYPIYTPATPTDFIVYYVSCTSKKYPTLYISPGLPRDNLLEALKEVLEYRTHHHVSVDEHGDFIHPSGYTRLLVDICKAM